MINDLNLTVTAGNHLPIRTGWYQYLPKNLIPENLNGFITKDVRECVCGVISSEQGYGFFHYNKVNDADDLAKKIKNDFQNSTSLKITLIGGNLASVFFPWEEENHNLVLSLRGSSNKFEGSLAFEKFKEQVASQSLEYAFFTSHLIDLRQSLKDCEIKTDSQNLIFYDYVKFDSIIAQKSYQVTDFRQQCKFKVLGIEDFIGYQNLAKVIHGLVSTGLFKDEDIEHYHCPMGNVVITNFNASPCIRTVEYDCFKPLRDGFNVANKLIEVPGAEISKSQEYFVTKAIKKIDFTKHQRRVI